VTDDVFDDESGMVEHPEPFAAGAPPMPASAESRSRRQRHRRQRPRWIRYLVIAVVVVLFAVFSWYEISSHPFGGPGKNTTIEVTSGESYSAVVNQFASRGVLSSALAFKIYSEIHGAPTVLPGFYTIATNSTFGAVHDLLATGPNTSAISVPPGFTLQEVANRLASTVGSNYGASFAALLRSGAVRSPFEPAGSSNLEGLIGAGTYLVPPSLSPQQLLTEMVARFTTLAAQDGLTPSTVARGHSAYSLVTIASVVQKEGYYVKNMPQVATVIDNRLAKGMPLQMDSTVLYALGQDGGTVTAADLKYVSPYNTYLNTGLPPTPICTVSNDALKATMNPPSGQWLYFTLISKDGTMAFSNTFAEQLQNEALAASRGL